MHRDGGASWEIFYVVPADEMRFIWASLAVTYQGLGRGSNLPWVLAIKGCVVCIRFNSHNRTN